MSKLYTWLKEQTHDMLHYMKHGKAKEKFMDSNTKDGLETLAVIIALILLIVLMAVLGKYLWNCVLCPLVSGVKKVQHWSQILGLHVLFFILF